MYPKNIFYWICSFAFILGGLWFLIQSIKDLEKFKQVTGPITLLAESHPASQQKPDLKDRFVQIAGFHKAFKLYLGGDSGDLSPEFEAYSKLKLGDTITIYYEEVPFFVTSGKENEKIIFLTQQINKANKPYYIRGDMDIYLANFFIIMGTLLGLFLYIYKD